MWDIFDKINSRWTTPEEVGQSYWMPVDEVGNFLEWIKWWIEDLIEENWDNIIVNEKKEYFDELWKDADINDVSTLKVEDIEKWMRVYSENEFGRW